MPFKLSLCVSGAWQVVRNEFDRYVKRQKENEREKFERSVNCSKIKRKNELMIKIFLLQKQTLMKNKIDRKHVS